MDYKMSIRFTWTDKWDDAWFRKLPVLSKILYTYLCDKCDIAGIWEIDLEKAVFDIGTDIGAITGAFKGLSDKYKTLSNNKIWLVNFLKRQKNLPLNPANLAHSAIINLLLPHKDVPEVFSVIDSEDIKTLTRGYASPYHSPHSNSIGKGNSKRGIVKGVFLPPTLAEIKDYVAAKGLSVSPDKFLEYFKESNWIDSKGNKVLNWKLKLLTWDSHCQVNGNSAPNKTKLFPITGKTCGFKGCNLPAVYKNTKGQYDSFRCSEHLPPEVKEKYC